MNKRRLSFILIFSMVLLIFTACSPSSKEIQESINQYKNNLNQLYSNLETEYSQNLSKEEWGSFSKEWMPKLTSSKPDKLSEKVPEDLEGRINILDNAKGKLMYLWNEYNNKIAKNKLNEKRVEDLKQEIEKLLE